MGPPVLDQLVAGPLVVGPPVLGLLDVGPLHVGPSFEGPLVVGPLDVGTPVVDPPVVVCGPQAANSSQGWRNCFLRVLSNFVLWPVLNMCFLCSLRVKDASEET